MITLNVNGQSQQLDVSPEMPLLWALRDRLNLTGTKFGCGHAMCGACVVHLDGQAARSCSIMVGEAAGSDHVGDHASDGKQAADGQRHRRRHGRQYLSVRHLCAHPPGHP
jgi:isoquinoline 1-oxidoreductase subunit alpha